MPPSGEAIPAMAAGDVTFGYNQIALGKPSDVIADRSTTPDKFMTDYHRHRNRFLCPGVPIVDVHVRAADGCFQDADEHIIAADVLEPELPRARDPAPLWL